MTPENFAYWLQGLFEVGKPESLDKVQTQQIKDHLELVFKKETPSYQTIEKVSGEVFFCASQQKLNAHQPMISFEGNNFYEKQQDLPGLPDLAYFPGISC